MKQPEVNPSITFEWSGRQCVVVNNNLETVVLCMEVGGTGSVFSVPRSDVPDIVVPVPSILEEMKAKYKPKELQ